MKNLLGQLSNKKYSFTWDDPMHTTQVSIEIPDLQDANYRVAGDWGPTYTINFKEMDNILISYDNESYRLDDKTLVLESPMLASERESYPLFICIKDLNKGLIFQLYIDQICDLKKVEVTRTVDYVNLYQANIHAEQPMLEEIA